MRRSSQPRRPPRAARGACRPGIRGPPVRCTRSVAGSRGARAKAGVVRPGPRGAPSGQAERPRARRRRRHARRPSVAYGSLGGPRQMKEMYRRSTRARNTDPSVVASPQRAGRGMCPRPTSPLACQGHRRNAPTQSAQGALPASRAPMRCAETPARGRRARRATSGQRSPEPKPFLRSCTWGGRSFQRSRHTRSTAFSSLRPCA